MRSFGISMLKKNFYHLIDEVEKGKPFVLTKYGKPIAKFGIVDGRDEQAKAISGSTKDGQSD